MSFNYRHSDEYNGGRDRRRGIGFQSPTSERADMRYGRVIGFQSPHSSTRGRRTNESHRSDNDTGRASAIRGRLRACFHEIGQKIRTDLSRHIIPMKNYITQPKHRYIIPDVVMISSFVKENVFELAQSNTLQMQVVLTIVRCLECFRTTQEQLVENHHGRDSSNNRNPVATPNRWNQAGTSSNVSNSGNNRNPVPAPNGWNQAGTSSTVSDSSNNRNPVPASNGWNQAGTSSTVSDSDNNRNPVPEEGHVSPDAEEQSIGSTEKDEPVSEENEFSDEDSDEDEDSDQHGCDPLLDDGVYKVGDVSLVEKENISPYWLQFVKERINVGDPITDIKAFLKLPFVKELNHHVFGKKYREKCAFQACDIVLYEYFPDRYQRKKKEANNSLVYHCCKCSMKFKLPPKKASSRISALHHGHENFGGLFNEGVFRTFAAAMADSVMLDAGIQYSVLCKQDNRNDALEPGSELQEQLLTCRCPCSLKLKAYRTKYHLYHTFDKWQEVVSNDQLEGEGKLEFINRTKGYENRFFGNKAYKVRCHEGKLYDPASMYEHLTPSSKTLRNQNHYDPFHKMFAIFIELLYCNENPRSCYFIHDEEGKDIPLFCKNKKDPQRPTTNTNT